LRRFDAVWRHTPAVGFTDYTTLAGRGGAAISLQGGDKLYLGHEDWLSGALVMLTQTAGAVTYVVEQWDGAAWRELSLQEGYVDLQTSWDIVEQAFDWSGHGVIEWGRSPFIWGLQTPLVNLWPEAGGDGDADADDIPFTPPEVTTPRYWVRIRFTSGGPVIVDRLLPLLYNTYATYSELASFMYLPEFDEVHQPTATEVRKSIRKHEDWLDSYARRSWRPRYRPNETQDFNPYGIKLDYGPTMFVVKMGLWNGTNFENLPMGRGEQGYLDRATAMIYPNTPSFRLRYYSFLLSRYLRQPKSFAVSYVYGEDFDLSDTGTVAQSVVLRRAAADLTVSADWSKLLTSGLDTVPKPEKVREWRETAQEQADTIRKLYTA